MARHERDELADALAAMSSGQAPPTPRTPPRAAPIAPVEPQNVVSSPASPQHLTDYAPAASAPLAAQRPRQALSHVLAQNVEYKRTLIPILLTCGVLLPLLGALPWFLSDSMIGEMPKWAMVCAFLTGAVLLALAIANMVQVKHQLERMPASQPRTTR